MNEYDPEILLEARQLRKARGSVDAVSRALRRAVDLRIAGADDAANAWQKIARVIQAIDAGTIAE